MKTETECPDFWEIMRTWLSLCWGLLVGDKNSQVLLGVFVASFESVALGILLATKGRQWEAALFVASLPVISVAGLAATLVLVACIGWLIIPRQKSK